MKTIDCFVPFAGTAQAEATVKGLQETGLVNKIVLLATADTTESLPQCELLQTDALQSSKTMKAIAEKAIADYVLLYTKHTTLNLGMFAGAHDSHPR